MRPRHRRTRRRTCRRRVTAASRSSSGASAASVAGSVGDSPTDRRTSRRRSLRTRRTPPPTMAALSFESSLPQAAPTRAARATVGQHREARGNSVHGGCPFRFIPARFVTSSRTSIACQFLAIAMVQGARPGHTGRESRSAGRFGRDRVRCGVRRRSPGLIHSMVCSELNDVITATVTASGSDTEPTVYTADHRRSGRCLTRSPLVSAAPCQGRHRRLFGVSPTGSTRDLPTCSRRT